ncbi:MAG TPA: hypothetical protein DC024_08365 [Clostridiales bacterium]|nr:hypothetical protein [Clostridiales bacterium]
MVNKKVPNISIVIPFFNNIQLTKECLRNIYQNTSLTSLNYEIIMVDDASTESYSFKEYEVLIKCITIVKNEINLGFSKSCNRGAEVANYEYLVFLNNDTIVLEGWLEGLLSVMNFDKQIGIVGSKLLYPDNTIQHAGVCFDDECMPFHIYNRLPSSFSGANKVREFAAVTGACFMIQSKLFKELGGFDEIYLNGIEDIDLCFKVREAGHKIVYSPDCTLYHLESKTRKKISTKQVKNLAVFKERWGKKIQPDYLNYYKEDLTEDVFLSDVFLKIKKRTIKENYVLAVWGAGSDGRHMISFLDFIEIEPHLFIDSDQKKWGSKIKGFQIYPPQYLLKLKKEGKKVFVIISSLWHQEIKKSLIEMGFTTNEFF